MGPGFCLEFLHFSKFSKTWQHAESWPGSRHHLTLHFPLLPLGVSLQCEEPRSLHFHRLSKPLHSPPWPALGGIRCTLSGRALSGKMPFAERTQGPGHLDMWKRVREADSCWSWLHGFLTVWGGLLLWRIRAGPFEHGNQNRGLLPEFKGTCGEW